VRFLDEWRAKRNQEWLEKWDREHRWSELADYNNRVSKGIVHTPEYAARMAEQQRQFNIEHGTEWWDDEGDGIIGRNQYGWISK